MRYWLLTSTTYGTWLPGDERGFVGRVWDTRPVQPDLTGNGGSLGQGTRPIEAGMEQPFIDPGRCHYWSHGPGA